MAKGKLEFGSDNYMSFECEAIPPKGMCTCYSTTCLKPHPDELPGGPAHLLRWKGSPKAFAAALRRAADWLDKHSDRNIHVEVD
jgi:hypothetical protein